MSVVAICFVLILAKMVFLARIAVDATLKDGELHR
jgi:hypothetical protein